MIWEDFLGAMNMAKVYMLRKGVSHNHDPELWSAPPQNDGLQHPSPTNSITLSTPWPSARSPPYHAIRFWDSIAEGLSHQIFHAFMILPKYCWDCAVINHISNSHPRVRYCTWSLHLHAKTLPNLFQNNLGLAIHSPTNIRTVTDYKSKTFR